MPYYKSTAAVDLTVELNRFESIFWHESNRNYFWRIGMH